MVCPTYKESQKVGNATKYYVSGILQQFGMLSKYQHVVDDISNPTLKKMGINIVIIMLSHQIVLLYPQ